MLKKVVVGFLLGCMVIWSAGLAEAGGKKAGWTRYGSSSTTRSSSSSDALNIAHLLDQQSDYQVAAEYLAKKINEHTDGQFSVRVHPDGSFISRDKMYDGLSYKRGTIAILSPYTNITTALKENAIQDIPYLFNSYDDYIKIMDTKLVSDIYKYASRTYSPTFYVLGAWNGGFKAIISNEAIRKPDDISRKKVITPLTNISHNKIKELNAIPISNIGIEAINFENGKIDAAELTPYSVYHKKLHENIKYITLVNYSYFASVIAINGPTWNIMPAKIKGNYSAPCSNINLGHVP